MNSAGSVQDQGANLEAARLRARALTQQLVTEHQQKLGGAEAPTAARDLPGSKDVSELSDEAVQAVVPTQKLDAAQDAVQEVNPAQKSGGPDVDGMLTALRDYLSGKLDSPEAAPKKGAGGAGGPEPEARRKKTKVEVEFQPHIQANTIQAPGDSIGEFRVRQEQVEEAAGPGQGSRKAGGGQGAGGAGAARGAGATQGAGATRASGEEGAAAGTLDRSEVSDDALEISQGAQGDQGPQGAQGLPTREDGKDREVQMSAQTAEALKGQMQGGKAPEAQSAGMLVDSGGAAAPIPTDGGVLRTGNWEQALWVHPGGKLDQTGGLIEKYRKLDDSPAEIWFDKRGQSTDEVAQQFAAEARKRPGDSGAQAKAQEVEKLRYPTESAPT